MIGLSVLVLLLTGITVGSLLADRKRLLSPSFILNATFLSSAIVGWIGNYLLWGEEVSFLTVAIVTLSVLLFNTGDLLTRWLLSRRKRNGRTKKPVEESKTYDDFGVQNKKTFITKKLFLGLCALFAFGILTSGLVFYYRLQQAIAIGYKPPNPDFLEYLRKATLSGSKLPFIVSRLGEISEGIGLVAVFVFFYVLFRTSKKRESFLILPLVLPTIVITLLSSARVGFILLAADFILSFAINIKTSEYRITRRRFFFFLGAVFSIFAIAFVAIGFLRGNILSISGIIDNLIFYYGGSIVAFDKFLRGWDHTLTTPFAANSFSGAYELLRRFFGSIPEPVNFEPYVHFANGQSTNVYSIVKPLVADFGILPAFLIMLALGVFYGLVYYNVARQKKGFSFWYVYYILLLFYLVLSVIVKQATSSLFTWRRMSYVLVMLGASEAVRLLLYGKDDFAFINRLRKSNSVKSNLIISIVGQAVVLGASLFVSFVFPKIMGKDTDFAAWQYFILLTGFVGLFHFGFCDGIYLRLGGKDIGNLKDEHLPQQTKLLFVLQTIVAAILGTIGLVVWIVGKEQKGLLVLCTAIYLWLYNIFTYCGYVFQATNNIKPYSFALIVNKVLFVGCSVVLFSFKINNFLPYIIAYIGGTLVSLMLLLVLGRRVFFAKNSPVQRPHIREFLATIKKGIWIMFGALSGSLILASSKYIAEWRWGASTFSDVAYCFTLMAIFMAFVSQVCIVLFPVLRRKSMNDVVNIKTSMDHAVSIATPSLLLFYYPAFFLIRLWLPQYESSLFYLGLILPIILFEIKTQLICTTYFKTLNKERPFFIINVSSMALSATLGLISAYALNSVMGVLFSACLGIVVQSIVGQIVISRLTNTRLSPFIIADVILLLAFGLSNYFLPWWGGLAVTAGCLVLFGAIFHKTIASVIRQAKAGRHKKDGANNPNEGVDNEGVNETN